MMWADRYLSLVLLNHLTVPSPTSILAQFTLLLLPPEQARTVAFKLPSGMPTHFAWSASNWNRNTWRPPQQMKCWPCSFICRPSTSRVTASPKLMVGAPIQPLADARQMRMDAWAGVAVATIPPARIAVKETIAAMIVRAL